MPAAVRRVPATARRLGKRSFTPIPARQSTPPAPADENACCASPEFEVLDGCKICINCGTQISEQNIVAEVTFGETSTGAATVQGGFVGETARHARTLGAAASRRIGGQYQSREETEQNGRSELRQLCPPLGIPPQTEETAFNLWKLASAHNFIQGRRTNEVAGVCLYAACRREKENTTLLMDISEALSVNVFRLGDIYKELSKALYLEVHQHIRPFVEIEPLLMKYCSKLEFGEKTRQVAEDAAKIVKRMNRDWIVTGRHPAGLCGACIVLAARMNNFRRTVREVVYIVKISEMTIGYRLQEFKKTRSSTMSVSEFRSKGLRLKDKQNPPSFSAADDRKKKLKQILDGRAARKSAHSSSAATPVPGTPGTPGANSADGTGATLAGSPPAVETTVRGLGDQPRPSPSPTTASSADITAEELRRDADGFVIPALPTTQSTESDDTTSTKKSRKKPKPMIRLTEADFEAEQVLQGEIDDILQAKECISACNDVERRKVDERAKLLAIEQRQASTLATAARLAALGRGTSIISDSEVIDPHEFDDDPEVQNAILSEAAVKIKETIWLQDNEDWLRAQQAKYLAVELEKAEDAGRPGGPAKKKKRKRSRMGDGSVLTESGTPVLSPADATQRMLEKRGGKNISKAINYAMLNKVFGGNVGPTENEMKRMRMNSGTDDSESESGRDSRGASVAPSEDISVANLDEQHGMVEGVAKAVDEAGARVERVRSGLDKGRRTSNKSTSSAEAGADEDSDGDTLFVPNHQNKDTRKIETAEATFHNDSTETSESKETAETKNNKDSPASTTVAEETSTAAQTEPSSRAKEASIEVPDDEDDDDEDEEEDDGDHEMGEGPTRWISDDPDNMDYGYEDDDYDAATNDATGTFGYDDYAYDDN